MRRPMTRHFAYGSLVFLLSGGLLGCSHDGADARDARHARRYAVQDCVGSIEVYSATRPPAQPYRVVAPLDAGFVGNWGWSATSRYNRMKKRACELGADAIIDSDDAAVDNRVTTTYQYDAYGRPVAVVQEGAKDLRRGTALAVQFVAPEVAVPQAAPPQIAAAPVVVAPPMSSPQVVVVPQPPPQVVVVQ